jgi:hypothetical protein
MMMIMHIEFVKLNDNGDALRYRQENRINGKTVLNQPKGCIESSSRFAHVNRIELHSNSVFDKASCLAFRALFRGLVPSNGSASIFVE